MDIEALSRLPPGQLRPLVPAFLGSYLELPPPARAEVVASATKVLSEVDDQELAAVMVRYGALGRDWTIYAAEPLLRRLSRAWMPLCVEEPGVSGLEHLEHARGRRQLWICNHLSYVDTQVTDSLLAQAGYSGVDEVLVVAGPKVYSEPFRRVAAAALNTLMTPQSTQLAHNSAPLSPREVGTLALRSLQQARTWQLERGPVLLYPEGSRSRSGRLGPFLRAAARYAREAELVIPLAITGSEQLFGYDERMRRARVSLRIGQPFEPTAGKTEALERAWDTIAALLPEPYRPEEGGSALA